MSRSCILKNRFFNSRITSSNVTIKEKILGYVFGPFGALVLNGVLAAYINVFYTDVLNLTSIWGGLFLAIFPMLSKILDIFMNILMGYVIERTKSKQGKARPWILFSAPLLCVAEILLFIIPSENQLVQLIWVVFSYNLFYSLAYTIYNLSHNLMVPLSTRNRIERGKLSLLNQFVLYIVPSIFTLLIFPMFIMPFIGIDRNLWLIIMGSLSALSLPCTIIEYYFTKERVTQEKDIEDKQKIPFKLQLKAIFTNKSMILMIMIIILTSTSASIKNIDLIYYSNWVLGKYNDGYTQVLLSLMVAIPFLIMIPLVWPITRKIGKRNFLLIGAIVFTIGSAICYISPTNLPVVLFGQFIKNLGVVPSTFLLLAIYTDGIDDMEWRNGFRPDGLAISIYNILIIALVGVATGLFNLLLSCSGYIAPTPGMSVEEIQRIIQPESVKQIIIFCFIGLEMSVGIISAILFIFVDVEKYLFRKQHVILQRQKDNLLAKGEIWVDPSIKNANELKQEEEELEQIYKNKLKQKCLKKGWDFDTKYQKHLSAIEKKRIKQEKQIALENERKNKKDILLIERYLDKLDKMSEEEISSYDKKMKLKAERFVKGWKKEEAKGLKTYQSTQEILLKSKE